MSELPEANESDSPDHQVAASGSSSGLDRVRISTAIDQAAESLRTANLDKPLSGFPAVFEQHKAVDPSLIPWSCVDALARSAEPARFAMIIVNQPIHSRDIFEKAWNASHLRYCADGGANRLYDLWDTESRSSFLPDLIKGDLDSIRSDVRAYYESLGVLVLQDRDEYSTDLMKCITEVERREQGDQSPLLLIGGLSGRIDQTVHTISLLHKLRATRPHIYVLSGESMAWVLDAGSHLIEIDHSTMGQTCGILPVGIDRAMVRTKGLKWDLDWSTSLDGEVSTSNHLLPEEPAVYLKTDKPILWCVETCMAVRIMNPVMRFVDLYDHQPLMKAYKGRYEQGRA